MTLMLHGHQRRSGRALLHELHSKYFHPTIRVYKNQSMKTCKGPIILKQIIGQCPNWFLLQVCKIPCSPQIILTCILVAMHENLDIRSSQSGLWSPMMKFHENLCKLIWFNCRNSLHFYNQILLMFSLKFMKSMSMSIPNWVSPISCQI